MIRSYGVVTPARDEAENLPRLAASLAAQTIVPQSWYIVDNGSTDGTLEVANALAAEQEWVRSSRYRVRPRPTAVPPS